MRLLGIFRPDVKALFLSGFTADKVTELGSISRMDGNRRMTADLTSRSPEDS